MQKIKKFFSKTPAAIYVMLLAIFSLPALASYDVNIPAPAAPISDQIYGLHMYILYICAGIFVVVFGAMF